MNLHGGLDERVANPYLAVMLSRLLLTVLAVMTGLAAQIAPGEARACSAKSAQVGIVATSGTPARVGVQRNPAIVRDELLVLADQPATIGTRPFSPLRDCPVLTGIDRARE